ncbi:hypothetical protein [Reinekea sp. G2M2-21]|uniref:hypothetical protein n=1 Tax=Reinekea sp. G2M2-21 TaxID=2788942 RepID=UPI0018AA265E|nr:hypothetical protein [Reinekea sp. G2M2-21]
MRNFLAILIILTISGCVAPGSRMYSPPDYLKENFKVAIKDKMPSDVLKAPSDFLGKEIHWIGILKDVEFVEYKGEQVAKLTLSQKYWDYVEDYSIQTERMFLSSKGGGDFIVLFRYKEKSQFEPYIRSAIGREDLMFVYGQFLWVESDKPVLGYLNGSFVDEKYYSTKIWEYDIERDEEGNVVANEMGLPKISNLKVLRVPGPGQND